jgi:hypothetical protein
LQVAAVIGARQRDDAPLDAEKEVFDARLVGVGDDAIRPDRRHRAHDGGGVRRGDDAALGQHDGVRFVCRQHRLEQIILRVSDRPAAKHAGYRLGAESSSVIPSGRSARSP